MPGPSAVLSDSPLHRDGDVLYRIVYRVELVTWRRRPLFEDVVVRHQVASLVEATAVAMGCRVVRCEVYPATVVVHVEVRPSLTPAAVARGLREGVSGPLAAEVEGAAEAVRQWGGVFVPQVMVTTGERDGV